MTDDTPHSARYVVRRGTKKFMVWDRHARGPAKFRGRQVVGLTEDQAREIKDELTNIYIAGACRTGAEGYKMSNEKVERNVTTAAEREARKAFRKVEAKVAMSDHQKAQKAFHENRARLKALRLAREAELKTKK